MGRSEKLSTLLDHLRILGIVTGLLGGDFNYTHIRNYSNYYVGDTDWYKEGLHIKIAST